MVFSIIELYPLKQNAKNEKAESQWFERWVWMEKNAIIYMIVYDVLDSKSYIFQQFHSPSKTFLHLSRWMENLTPDWSKQMKGMSRLLCYDALSDKCLMYL